MARYGREYPAGRYMRRNMGETGMGYGTEYERGETGARGGWSSGRGHGWSGMEGGRGWSGMGRSQGLGGLDESWTSTAHGRGRQYGNEGQYGSQNRYGGQGTYRSQGAYGGENQYGNQGWGERDWTRSGGYGTEGRSRYGSEYMGGSAGYGGGHGSGYGRWRPYEGMQGGEGRMGYDYDEDFGDRIRRGWGRLREEARGWMGRGYDRGW